MIQSDVELSATQDRIAFFERTVAQMRVTCSPTEFPHMAGAWLTEINRMHKEVMDYLSRHSNDKVPAEVGP